MATKLFVSCVCGGVTELLVNNDDLDVIQRFILPRLRIIFKEESNRAKVEANNFSELELKLDPQSRVLRSTHMTWEKHSVKNIDWRFGVVWSW